MKSIKQLFEGLVALNEKLIIIGKGSDYGQIIFLAGGAGSGKGFASTHMIDNNKFKVRDVDEWKRLFLKISALKQEYPEIRDLNLKDPKDVLTLHAFIDQLKIKDKTLSLLFQNLIPGRYPNLLFDMTAKDPKSLFNQADLLVKMGYEPKNINIIWILTNYNVAANRNANRSRVVSPDILKQTHSGAANTMKGIIFNNLLDRSSIDGEIFVVLNNEDAVKFYNGKKVLQDFTYMKVKQPGKEVELNASNKTNLETWIDDNAPK